MEFVAATNNRKKLEELDRILSAAGHKVLSLADIGLSAEAPENGETFAENALQKAEAVCKASGRPTIADDSGLCVDALDGAPGIYSARFAGSHGDDEANNAKLLSLLERKPYAQRKARFVCAVALMMPDGGVLAAEGECEGQIGFAPSGNGGFGYDPLFYINNKSFAELDGEEKDAVSHRAVALRHLLEQLPEFLAQHGGQ